MSLLRLYSLSEAGIPRLGTAKKQKKHPKLAGSVTLPPGQDLDDVDTDGPFGNQFGPPDLDSSEEDDDLGPDVDYDDPVEPDSDGDDVPAEPEVKPAAAFTSKSAAPSKAMQGGKAGVNVNADKATLKAFAKAFDAVRTKDEDLQDWVDDCIREIERAAKSNDSSLTLPKFEATPDLDNDFNDGGSEDEDY